MELKKMHFPCQNISQVQIIRIKHHFMKLIHFKNKLVKKIKKIF